MNELELAELFVHVTHPASEGWQQVSGRKLQTADADVEVDMIMYKKGKPPVGVIHMAAPYVSASDLQVAMQAKTYMENYLNGRVASVLLVYRELLARPHRIPKGIHILTITEGDTTVQSLN